MANATQDMTRIRQCSQTMSEEALRQSSPTGTTPRKRQWQYIDKWERTQNRPDLLREFRRRHGRTSLDDVAQDVRANLPGSDLDTSDEGHGHGGHGMEPITDGKDIKMEVEPDWQPSHRTSPFDSSNSSKEPEHSSSTGEGLPPIKIDREPELAKIRTARALQERPTNIDVRSRNTRRRR